MSVAILLTWKVIWSAGFSEAVRREYFTCNFSCSSGPRSRECLLLLSHVSVRSLSEDMIQRRACTHMHPRMQILTNDRTIRWSVFLCWRHRCYLLAQSYPFQVKSLSFICLKVFKNLCKWSVQTKSYSLRKCPDKRLFEDFDWESNEFQGWNFKYRN